MIDTGSSIGQSGDPALLAMGTTLVVEVDASQADSAGQSTHPAELPAPVKVDVGALLDDGANSAVSNDAVVVDLKLPVSGDETVSPSKVVIDLGDSKGNPSSDSSFVVVDVPSNGEVGTQPSAVIDVSPVSTSDPPEVVVVDLRTGNASGDGDAHITMVDAGSSDAATSAAVTAALNAQVEDEKVRAGDVVGAVLDAIDGASVGTGAPIVVVLTDADQPPPTVTLAEGQGELTAAELKAVLGAKELGASDVRITRIITGNYISQFTYSVRTVLPQHSPQILPPIVRMIRRMRPVIHMEPAVSLAHAQSMEAGSSLPHHLAQKSSRSVTLRGGSGGAVVGAGAGRVASTVGGYSTESGGSAASASGPMGP